MNDPNFTPVEIGAHAIEAFERELDRMLSSAPSDEEVEDARDPLLILSTLSV